MASPKSIIADASEQVPSIEIGPGQKLFSPQVLSQLEALLPEFIATRRWYRSKTRKITRALIEDALPVEDANSAILIIRLEYAEGESDRYVLTVRFDEDIEARSPANAQDSLATFRTADGRRGTVSEALSHEALRGWLLTAIAADAKVKGREGELTASRTSAFSSNLSADESKLPSTVSQAEQSNTSIVYGDRYILKLFRKVEPGINPDIEIGRFLTERGFRNTPAVVGLLEYRSPRTEPVYAAILQEFVRNQGDAWKYTLESLSGFFHRALIGSSNPPALSSDHPLHLATALIPSNAQELIGPYLESARLLGERTAQMHAALADTSGGPDFAPEEFTSVDGENLYREMLRQAEATFGLLKQKADTLKGTIADEAQKLLALESSVISRFSGLRTQSVIASRIRFHGDYHLGQVLFTGSDFMIIDFEGEPARPLNERREKALALRDVAGMVRSFQYAAYAALFGQVPGLTVKPEQVEAVEAWAAFWFTTVSAIYLQGYFSVASGNKFVPDSDGERRSLLDAFLLQKALYEVAYELNNRPDWVRIPLRGILGLVS